MSVIEEYDGLFPAWIPKNILEYMKRYHAAVDVSVGSTDGINGYGCRVDLVVRVSRYAESCDKCGYHSLFNPNPKDWMPGEKFHSRCSLRKEWCDVFIWRKNNGDERTLEQCFNEFLKKNPIGYSSAIETWSNL